MWEPTGTIDRTKISDKLSLGLIACTHPVKISMPMSIRPAIVSAIVLLCFSLSAVGQTMSSEMTVIIRTTMAADGTLNQETHRKFWELAKEQFNADPTSSKLILYGENLRELTLGLQGWQREAWKSARLSSLEGSVVETQRLKELRANMVGNHRAAASSIFRGSIDVDEYMKGFEATWESVVKPNTNKLLVAASKGETIRSATGEVTPPITLELIDTTIASIGQGLERGLKLLNPVWSDDFSDSKTFIVGLEKNNRLPPIFFELLLSAREPSGTIFWIDGDTGSEMEAEARVEISDFYIFIRKNVRGFVSSGSIRAWCIDRVSLKITAFATGVDLDDCEALSLSYFRFRVGKLVSESEFNLEIQSHAESVKTESMMRQINEQKQFQDRLNKRKI